MDTSHIRRRMVSARLVRLLFVTLAALVVILAIAPATALARSYTMDPVTIDATVREDGTLVVTEDRTFNFDGSYHGVYWDIPEGSYNGTAVGVTVDGVGEVTGSGLSAFGLSSAQTSGTYVTSDTTNDSGTQVKRITLYSTKSDESATYRITYEVTGAVSDWADTGELYWKFVSDGWDEPSSDVTCTIHLPVPLGTAVTAGDNVRAWAHGPLDGEVTVTSDGAVFTVPEVGTSEYAEARLCFPTSWLAGMTPSSTAKLDSIVSEETAWADEANAQRENARRILYGTVAGLAVLLAGSLVLGLRARARYRRNHRGTFHDEYWRDVPSGDHPAVLGGLLHQGSPEPQDFTASLMRLTDMGAIRLDLVTTTRRALFGDRQDKDYRLTRVARVADTLTDPMDVATMRFLFDEVARTAAAGQDGGDGDTLLFSDVSAVAKGHAESYSGWMSSWKDQLTASCEARGLFVDENRSGKGTLVALVVADLCLGVGGGVALLAFGALGTVVGVAGLLLAAADVCLAVAYVILLSRMRPLSPEAIDIKARMVALRRWLCEFTRLGEAVPDDVVLWNKLLVMAVVLGVSKQVIDQLKVAMPELLENPAFVPTYCWYMGYAGMPAPAEIFTSAYNDAARVSMAQLAGSRGSSGGGFGGGFSGGGGGGFGGGGGGGAF